MREFTRICKLSAWIFFVPFISINFCLLISVNPLIFENTIFVVDQIGRSGFTIPYLDGSLSISRASRTYPQYLIFKPSMIATGCLLIIYWMTTNDIMREFSLSKKNFYFKNFGILSAVFLMIHSIFLGLNFDNDFLKLAKRIFLVGFILFELFAQSLLIYNFYKYKQKIKFFINSFVLKLKFILVGLLVLVAIIVSPILSSNDYTHLKHALEWNYFLGIILFYLLTSFFWRRTT
jgi:hypothetical protein